MADISIADVRAKYPQYKDLTDQALADALHGKFYADMPKDQFYSKIGLTSAGPKHGAVQQGVDPGFFTRLNQRGEQSLKGAPAAPLSANAGMGSKIADTIADAQDYLGGATDTLSRGFTWGLSDDAAAAGTALGQTLKGNTLTDTMTGNTSFSKRFQAADAFENQKIDKFKEQNPIVGNTLEIGGMVASPLGRVGQGWVAAGPSTANRALRLGAAGLPQGALLGGAYSEGGLADRAQSAAINSAIAGPLSAAIGPLAETLVGATSAVARPVAQTIRNRYTAATNPALQANKLFQQALQRDQLTPAQLAVRTAQAGGPQAIVDIAGPNVQALGRQATVAPGKARTVAADLFTSRQADQADRVAAELKRATTSKDYGSTMDQILTNRSAASRPAYQAFENVDSEQFNTPFIQNLVHSPTGQGLLGKARQIYTLEKLAEKVPGNVMEPILDGEGQLTLGTVPSARAVNYLKQAIDQEVQPFINQITGKVESPLGNAWEGLRRTYVNHIDDITPLYKAARSAYAGPTAMAEAMKKGRTYLQKGNALEKIAEFKKFGDSEKDMFRVGVVDDALNSLGVKADNLNAYNTLWNSPNKRTLLKQIFKDEAAFKRFGAAMARENRMGETAKAVSGGSITGRIEAEKADATDQLSMISDIWKLIKGPGISARANALSSLGNRTRGINEPVADELAKILFSTNRAQNAASVRGLGALPALPAIPPGNVIARNLSRPGVAGGISGVPALSGFGLYRASGGQ